MGSIPPLRKRISARPKTERTCPICGKIFMRVRSKPANYCSSACYNEMRSVSPEHFWLRVDTSGGPTACWPWQGTVTGAGYGCYGAGGKLTPAHRTAYELTVGPIPNGLFVCHTCDNRVCCNPLHHFLGTHADNMKDMSDKGRASTGERHWQNKHPYLRKTGDDHWSHLHPENVKRGETHWKTRITEDVISGMRDMRENGATLKAIGEQYGFSLGHVSKVLLRG